MFESQISGCSGVVSTIMVQLMSYNVWREETDVLVLFD